MNNTKSNENIYKYNCSTCPAYPLMDKCSLATKYPLCDYRCHLNENAKEYYKEMRKRCGN